MRKTMFIAGLLSAAFLLGLIGVSTSVSVLSPEVVLGTPILKFFTKVRLIPFAGLVQAQVPLTDQKAFWAKVDGFADREGFEYDKVWAVQFSKQGNRLQDTYNRKDGIQFTVQTQYGNPQASFNAKGDLDEGKKVVVQFQKALRDYNFVSLPTPTNSIVGGH